MKRLSLLLLLLAPAALFAQQSQGERWHLVTLPGLLHGNGNIIITITKDSFITSFEPATPEDSARVARRGKQDRPERMKLVSRRTARTGDTMTFLVREKSKKHIAFRMIQETADRHMLLVADDMRSKDPVYPPDSLYVPFGSVVSEAKYTELMKLKDAATITKDEFIFILKDIRNVFANVKARHDYEERRRKFMGYSLIFEIASRATDDLEALGYSPFRWSRSLDDVIEQFKDDPDIKHMLEELMQIIR